MIIDTTRKAILILCDHDTLYAAIQLKLSDLTDVELLRFEPEGKAQYTDRDFDLLIAATISPTKNPLSILDSALSSAFLPAQAGNAPVLIISEHPSSPSDNKITYLNFPFDMDKLALTVTEILAKRSRQNSNLVC